MVGASERSSSPMHVLTRRPPASTESAHRGASRSGGTRALGVSGQVVQAKLRVGPQDDPLEREADRAAETVMAGGAAPVRGAAGLAAQRACAGCADDEEEIRMKAAPGRPQPEARAAMADGAGLAAAGAPLTADVRAYFEPRFGRDLGEVRLHTGPKAVQGAEVMRARAFTLGRSIGFAAGEYAPHTREGRRLLAHELAHVVQQSLDPTGGAVPIIRRTLDGRSDCPAGVNEAPAEPITALEAADAQAQTMALGSSELLFVESSTFDDPTFGPGEAYAAYARRFGTAPPTARGRFRNRFTGGVSPDENEAIRGELAFLSRRFEQLDAYISGPIRYRCPGRRRVTFGGCTDRCAADDLAISCAPTDGRTLVVCPAFWSDPLMGSVDQRAGTIIHEGVHMRFNVERHGHANANQRGRNAECYEAFVADLYGFDAEVDDCPEAMP